MFETFKDWLKNDSGELNESAIWKAYSSASDEYDDVDAALQKYILNPNDLYAVEHYGKELIHRYPNDKRITIYRGLNFATKDDYNKFIKKLSTGRLTLKGYSSWSTNKKIAEEFAKTRKFYAEFISPDDPILKLISDRNKSKENITGYRGMILTTRIRPNTGIMINKFKETGEEEVILPSGTYSIKYSEVLTFKDKYYKKNRK